MGHDESSKRVAETVARQVVQAKDERDRLDDQLAEVPRWRWRRRRALAATRHYWERKEVGGLAVFDAAGASRRRR